MSPTPYDAEDAIKLIEERIRRENPKPRIRVKARTAPLSFEQWCIYAAKWVSLQPIGFARDRLLGEFPKPLEINNFKGACPARDWDKSHRMRWEGDHRAVCRDCGGVYVE